MTKKVKDIPSTLPVVTDKFPIVGIGASAGGLSAFEAFFLNMPENTQVNMAFVLVQHLSPTYKSLLPEIIQRHTTMKVYEVLDGIIVQPNSVYIIPPNYDMAFLQGSLQLMKLIKRDKQRLPIDFFFKSLAMDQRELAIGIILSGAGSDGSQGLRAIKDEGGMVMAQAPAGLEFDSMPRTAIETGLVDFVLPVEKMPAKLIDYVSHAYGKLAPLNGSHQGQHQETAMKKIFLLLQNQTGHDFSQYKPNTIHRRIARRLSVHQIAEFNDYVKYLQQTPSEIDALFLDVLIGVTQFFRDTEAFVSLAEQIVTKLLVNKTLGSVIRVWVPGCSTGEEAFSIAILLVEAMEQVKLNVVVQIFATDINPRAIIAARAGCYPASIIENISPERLARFYILQADGITYRVHRDIRDMVVFSEHDLLKDPPFSKLDLISCRNVLIYMNSALQKKLIPLFHYSLKENGLLFLGTSEGISDYGDLFRTLDHKTKLYQRKESLYENPHRARSHYLPTMSAINASVRHHFIPTTAPLKPPLRTLTEQMLLQHISCCAALVNDLGDIYYLHGRTGQYLEPAMGESGINNILKMSRVGLASRLSVALHKVVLSGKMVRDEGLRVKTNGHFSLVNISVYPVLSKLSDLSETSLYGVVFEPALSSYSEDTPSLGTELRVSPEAAGDEHQQLIDDLKQELSLKDDYLFAVREELETSNEELKSTNEEMQSVNEELQSTNEELETSKEELQSVNEELNTVNTELQAKIEIAAQVIVDMNNLLDGSGIATLFVDTNLRILRFTPLMTQVINLIEHDVNRPINHIVSNFVDYQDLVVDINAVLNTLMPINKRVQTIDQKWYKLRLQPYRTVKNIIKGVVMTFVDVSDIVIIEENLEKANRLLRLAIVVRDANDAITVQDLVGHTLAWNPSAERLYGWTEQEALQLNVSARIPVGLVAEELNTVQALSQAKVFKPYFTQRLHKNGQVLSVNITATALMDEAGQMYAVATTERLSEHAVI